jgi:hypothetical protein
MEYEKLKLHYAKIDLDGDIPMIEFNNIEEVIRYLDTVLPKYENNIIYLITHKNEIFISESISYILHMLDQIHICAFDWHGEDENSIYLHEYPSFEEAYLVALMMKEENKLCYSSETKSSPYWQKTDPAILDIL